MDIKKYIFMVTWLLALAFGLRYLWAYENTPGRTSLSSTQLMPSEVLTSTDRPTLVMFAHPQCPCSRASVAELTKVLSRFPKGFHSKIYFYRPPSKDISWVQSALWKTASALPGTEVFVDENGLLAKKFKAKISGEVFVLSPKNTILYHGGLTPSRGHEGDSIGKQSLQQIAKQEPVAVTEGPVFGCSLYQEQTSVTEKHHE